jgi:short subunit dehydrogenase-like uncharacterized protein
MAAQRDLAVGILGATGVTGKQAVAYMRERAPQLGVRWAMAGRDPARLEAMVADWPEDARPELVRADVADADSLRALAERVRVVINFAGPFARLAPPVIAACVEAETHYLDVSGELDFVARMIDEHHERERERGVRVVQVAGIEALPFDLLTRLGIERLAAEHDSRPESADLVMTMTPPPGMPRPSDGVSRGTLESLRGWLGGEDSRLMGDPAALVRGLADAEEVRRISPIELGSRRDPEGGVLVPMVPSPDLNPPVIQRSLALAGLPPIRYRESVALAGIVGFRPAQIALAGTLGAVNRGLRRLSTAPAPLRRAGGALIWALVPSSASRPRPDRIEAWRWAIDAVVHGAAGAEARVRVEGRGHTGYLATSRMTTEAGLLLADPDADVPEGGGCLTPAAALGTAELARFAAAGLDFEPG